MGHCAFRPRETRTVLTPGQFIWAAITLCSGTNPVREGGLGVLTITPQSERFEQVTHGGIRRSCHYTSRAWRCIYIKMLLKLNMFSYWTSVHKTWSRNKSQCINSLPMLNLWFDYFVISWNPDFLQTYNQSQSVCNNIWGRVWLFPSLVCDLYWSLINVWAWHYAVARRHCLRSLVRVCFLTPSVSKTVCK